MEISWSLDTERELERTTAICKITHHTPEELLLIPSEGLFEYGLHVHSVKI